MSLPATSDVVVIGAGPAGLAAATTAAELGLKTLLLDEQAGPGGQIYRAIADCPVKDRRILGKDYWRGATLLAPLRASGATYVPGATVWSVDSALEVGVSVAGGAQLIQARQVILATGALERPLPVPGWTLPGVMTAGAGQILLKASGLVPDGRVILAGNGPLLHLVAAQLRRAGVDIAALLELRAPGNRRRALPWLPEFALASPYVGKGLALLRETARLAIIRGVWQLAAEGDGRVQRVRYRRGGAEATSDCDLLLLHQGVVPNVNLSFAIGCAHDWDPRQLCWRPRLDDWGASSVAGVAIAGDGGGIAGAEAAEESGRLAALGAAARLGAIDGTRRNVLAAPIRHRLERARRGRRFLDAWYRPADWARIPEGDTTVCRCEEVTAGQVRAAVAVGCMGPNQMKAFLRCGMGPCQGRQCGLTVQALIAEALGRPEGEVGYFRLRPPVKPITLAELAALPKTETAAKAVVRG